jgi:hypothetical protein
VRQRRERKWINFAEIAEWCSKEDGSIVPNEQKRVAAFDTLQGDLLAGEFDENGRSRVLYLHPSTTKSRMTRAWLMDAIDNNYDGHRGRAQFLPCCWIPRRSFDRWLVKHRLANKPARFEPRDKTRDLAIDNEDHVEWVDPDYDERTGPVIREDTRRGAAEEPSPGGPRKGSPALERARKAIGLIYPDGVPSQEIVPNAILCRHVGEKLRVNKLPGVSDDTILRAAGRRRK